MNRLLSVIAVVLAVALLTPSPSFAESKLACPPSTVVEASAEIAAVKAELETQLAIRGILVGPPKERGCPRTVADLVATEKGFRVALTAEDGRTEERVLSTPDLVAVWIESWLTRDLDDSLLSVRIQPSAERSSVTSATAQRADGSTSPETSTSTFIWFGVELLTGADESSWRGLRVGGCKTVGLACLGGAARIADNRGFDGGSLFPVNRLLAEALVIASVPMAVGQATLEPSLGAGLGWLRTVAACVDSIPETYTRDDSQASLSLHLEARIAMSFTISESLSAELAAFGALRPFADEGKRITPGGAPLPDPEASLPAQPTHALGGALGLRIEL